MKTLIIYYSFEGNCELIANKISELTGADILRLKPKKEKKSKGFSKFIWGGTQVVMKSKPELEEYNVNLNDYDLIYIGTPVWAGTFAPALSTFFSDNVIENKNIALYCCYSGSEGNTFTKMRSELSNNNIISQMGFKDPFSKGNDLDVSKQLSQWIKEIIEK